jgi:hypothetical protein
MRHNRQYWGLPAWAWGLTLALMFSIALLAVVRTVKGREIPFEEFRGHAREIAKALEAFARDHGGRFPDDGKDNDSPPGLSPKYIQWNKEWNVDYEVHDNGHGGRYIALEYLGRYRTDVPFHAQGLTRDPTTRRLYGRGQPIPRRLNRIWVFYEEAPIYYPQTK